MNYDHLDNILPPPPLTGRSVRGASVPTIPAVAMLDMAIATVSRGAGQATTEEPTERQHSTVDQGEDLMFDGSHTEQPVCESSFNYSNEGAQEFYQDHSNTNNTSHPSNNNSSSTHQSSKIHNSCGNNNSSRSNSRSNHTSSSGVVKQVDEVAITSPLSPPPRRSGMTARC